MKYILILAVLLASCNKKDSPPPDPPTATVRINFDSDSVKYLNMSVNWPGGESMGYHGSVERECIAGDMQINYTVWHSYGSARPPVPISFTSQIFVNGVMKKEIKAQGNYQYNLTISP